MIEYIILKNVKIFINNIVIINVFIFYRDFERNLNRKFYNNINNEKKFKNE